ncbi:hypothetical protein [Streptomyces sp. NPDC001678]|uniref:hypothetical protein n=1 Tax=Streptomyces sp. NPDC001678 TaxID=3364599 RepID=UPI0036CC4B73
MAEPFRPPTARPLFRLVSPTGAGPQFLDPPAPGLDAGLETVMAHRPVRLPGGTATV